MAHGWIVEKCQIDHWIAAPVFAFRRVDCIVAIQWLQGPVADNGRNESMLGLSTTACGQICLQAVVEDDGLVRQCGGRQKLSVTPKVWTLSAPIPVRKVGSRS